MSKGIFISFEGTDGSGKTTVLAKVYEHLKSKGHNVVVTREPGGTNNVIAEDIRNILLNKVHYKFDDRAEALLFAASRAQHVHDFIKPNINEGNIVLCDRYVDSSLVYQGLGRGLGIKKIWEINEFAMNNCIPDFTIFLMVKPEVGIERIKKTRLEKMDRIDAEKEIHQKVYDGYQLLLSTDTTGRLIEIDASKEIDEVIANVIKIIEEKIK